MSSKYILAFSRFLFLFKNFFKNYETYFYFWNNISYRDLFIILSADGSVRMGPGFFTLYLIVKSKPNQPVFDRSVMVRTVRESLISYCCCFTNKFSRPSWAGRFFSYAFNLLSSGAQNCLVAIFDKKSIF